MDKRFIIVIVLLFSTLMIRATNVVQRIDSLLQQAKITASDTQRISLFFDIARQYYYFKDNDSLALLYAQKALQFSEKNNRYRLPEINFLLGDIYLWKDNPKQALKHYRTLFKMDSLPAKMEVNLNSRIADVYKKTGEWQKALTYYRKSIALGEPIGYYNDVIASYIMLGNIFFTIDQSDSALHYYTIAKQYLNTKRYDADYMHTVLLNMAAVNYTKQKYTEALATWKELLALQQKEKKTENQGQLFFNIGSAYLKINRLDSAEKYFALAEKEAQAEKKWTYLQEYYPVLSEMALLQHDSAKAIAYLKQLLAVKDTVHRQQHEKNMHELLVKYDAEKKEAENKLLKSEQQRKNMLILTLTVGVFLLALLLFLLYRNLVVTKNQKQIIEQQNKILEVKNEEITSSIIYARRLQRAILPPIDILEQFFPQHFIMYKPKDIVSGDFYWFEKVDDKLYFAVADCTGHGVPGAIVSVVCSYTLSRVVVEERVSETDKILERTKLLLIERFSRSNEYIYDGMDISLCCLDTNTMELQWTGANIPLYIIRPANDKPEFIEIKPDFQIVGKSMKHQPFSVHTIQIQSCDMVYLFSDGYADQFGGEKGKKLKYPAFKEVLLSTCHRTMPDQKAYLEHFFEQWKGNLEQIDDICIFGIKF